jgi:hypothetical protein
MKHSWYSAHASAQFGFSIYKDENGLEIKVTEVSSNDTPIGRWNDYVYTGLVGEFVKSNNVKLSGDVDALLDFAYAALAVEKRCQEQFPRTGRCFCHTCKVTNSSN